MCKKTYLKKCVVMGLLLLGIYCAAASADTIYVDTNAAGLNNGTSWANAHNYLQDALANAGSGDEIRVAQGVYTPAEPGGDRTATFQLIDGIEIYGGFPASGGEWEDRDPNAHETILSGDLNDDDSDWNNMGDNSFHVIRGNGIDPNVILDGFTITAGNATTSPPDESFYYGGGIYWDEGTLTVIDCIFKNNKALCGGGIFNDTGMVLLRNCTFTNNYLTFTNFGGGAGVANATGNLTLFNCTFSHNLMNVGFFGGGGLWNNSGNVTLTSCIFRDNETFDCEGGGGIYNYSGDMTLTDCSFIGNEAIDYNYSSGRWIYDDGGGIYNDGGINNEGSVTLTNCMFAGNKGKFG